MKSEPVTISHRQLYSDEEFENVSSSEKNGSLIPESFSLAGMEISVHFDDKLHKKGVVGMADYRSQEIRMDNSIASHRFLEQTFLHELVHWIFFVMGEQKLQAKEKFIDLFAYFLHQALLTSIKEEKMTDHVHSNIVPDSFQLAGFEIKVNLEPVGEGDKSLSSDSNYRQQTITINPETGCSGVIEYLYVNQLVNWILFVMGEKKLRNKNKFTDGFAHFLHQALVSARKVQNVEGPVDEEYPELSEEPFDPEDACCGFRALAESYYEECDYDDESSDLEPWTDYSEDCARSEDEGWFYDDYED